MSQYIGYYISKKIPASRSPQASALNPKACIFTPRLITRSRLNPFAAVFTPKTYHRLYDVFDGEWMSIPNYRQNYPAVYSVLRKGRAPRRSEAYGDERESFHQLCQFLSGNIGHSALASHIRRSVHLMFDRIHEYERLNKAVMLLRPFELKVYALLEYFGDEYEGGNVGVVSEYYGGGMSGGYGYGGVAHDEGFYHGSLANRGYGPVEYHAGGFGGTDRLGGVFGGYQDGSGGAGFGGYGGGGNSPYQHQMFVQGLYGTSGEQQYGNGGYNGGEDEHGGW